MYVVPVVSGMMTWHTPVAPVVQVVNLEFYTFESWVRAPGGSDFDFISNTQIGKMGTKQKMGKDFFF